MINKIYANDNKSYNRLSSLQCDEIMKFKNKVNSGEYRYETLKNCPCCNNSTYHLIAEKDRYGIYSPIVICVECGCFCKSTIIGRKL
jgi:hypothetical protein